MMDAGAARESRGPGAVAWNPALIAPWRFRRWVTLLGGDKLSLDSENFIFFYKVKLNCAYVLSLMQQFLDLE